MDGCHRGNPRRRTRRTLLIPCNGRRLDVVAAADDFGDLQPSCGCSSPPTLNLSRPPSQTPRTRTHDGPSIIGIWDSGRGDLSERHDEIIRERLKRSA